MGLFKHLIRDTAGSQNPIKTTKGFLIGVVEAEGEASNQNILLRDVFVDYLDIISQLEQGKFIILGRKGSGKSAIGEYLVSSMEDKPNAFGTLIGHEKIELERLILGIYSEDCHKDHEQLFQWVVLTQILNLMSQNQNIQEWPEMILLRKFLQKNRGYVGIDRYEIYDYTTSTNFEIEIEYLKRLASRFGKKWSFKSSKAAYYKLLPLLEDTMFELMMRDKENSYLLIFDDLDIGYKKTRDNLDILVDLLRVVKGYNLKFAKYGLLSKILVLLRDDIAKHIQYYPDTAKIFASYATTLRWYQENENEDDLLLKQFINKRIAYNFKRLNLDYNTDDPWGSFIDTTNRYPKTTFKYILDHTFYRPRDLVLFFKDIDRRNYTIPINHQNVKTLIGFYASQMIEEIKNELSSQLQDEEIDVILRTICDFTDKNGTTYELLAKALHEAGIEEDPCIKMLFEYSLLGNRNSQGELNYKFREREGHVCEMDIRQRFVLHNVLRTYARMNYRT